MGVVAAGAPEGPKNEWTPQRARAYVEKLIRELTDGLYSDQFLEDCIELTVRLGRQAKGRPLRYRWDITEGKIALHIEIVR